MINGLLGVIIGLFIGYQIQQIKRLLLEIKSAIPKKETLQPSIVDVESPVAHAIRANGSPTAVVLPKSPQQLEFEENEELRKLNPGA